MPNRIKRWNGSAWVNVVSEDGVRLLDTNSSHALVLTAGSDLTADRTLSIVTGDANRTLTISGNVSLDQSVLTTSTPTFSRLTLSQSTGTAPLTVSSTTLVTNLNADLLDGQQGSWYQDLANTTGTLPDARFSGTYTGVTEISMSTIRLTSTGDASIASTTHALQIGPSASTNLIADQNEIMARNNGATSILYLNTNGGEVYVGDDLTVAGTIGGDGSGITGVAVRVASTPVSFAAGTTSGTTSRDLATWTNIGTASVSRIWMFSFNLRYSTSAAGATDRFALTLNDDTAGTVLQTWIIDGQTSAISFPGAYTFTKTGVFSMTLSVVRTGGSGTLTVSNSGSDNYSTASVVGIRS